MFELCQNCKQRSTAAPDVALCRECGDEPRPIEWTELDRPMDLSGSVSAECYARKCTPPNTRYCDRGDRRVALGMTDAGDVLCLPHLILAEPDHWPGAREPETADGWAAYLAACSRRWQESLS